MTPRFLPPLSGARPRFRRRKPHWPATSHHNITIGTPVSGASNFKQPQGQVKMLICAMDYPRTDKRVHCTIAGEHMANLAEQCGLVHNSTLKVITDKQRPLTKQMAFQEIKALLSGSKAGDTFIFYYHGHGAKPGHGLGDGDRWDDSEKDDAYCFQDADGHVTKASLWSDDAFAQQIPDVLPDGVNLLVLSDCCYSDTICDFSKPAWKNKRAVSVSGCLDTQTAKGTGTGGVFTYSMLLAIEKLSQLSRTQQGSDYSVGQLYNVTLAQQQKHFRRASQNIAIERTSACVNDAMRWPLIPKGVYTSPLNQPRSRGLSPQGSDPSVPSHVLEACSNPSGCGSIEEDDLKPAQIRDTRPIHTQTLCTGVPSTAMTTFPPSFASELRTLASNTVSWVEAQAKQDADSADRSYLEMDECRKRLAAFNVLDDSECQQVVDMAATSGALVLCEVLQFGGIKERQEESDLARVPRPKVLGTDVWYRTQQLFVSAARKACHGIAGRSEAVALEDRSIDAHMLRLTGPSTPSARLSRLASVGSLVGNRSPSAALTEQKLWVFSGCQDRQTSADAMIDGKRQGAFTWAFGKALTDMKFRCQYDDLLNMIRRNTKSGHYEQIPGLSTTTEDNYRHWFLEQSPDT